MLKRMDYFHIAKCKIFYHKSHNSVIKTCHPKPLYIIWVQNIVCWPHCISPVCHTITIHSFSLSLSLSHSLAGLFVCLLLFSGRGFYSTYKMDMHVGSVHRWHTLNVTKYSFSSITILSTTRAHTSRNKTIVSYIRSIVNAIEKAITYITKYYILMQTPGHIHMCAAKTKLKASVVS